MSYLIRPKKGEYSSYFDSYVALVGDGNILDILEDQKRSFSDFVQNIPAEKANHAYAPGKWTILQVINHINDVERVFTYRALALSRNEAKPLEGFDHNHYVDAVNLSNRSLLDLVLEFESIRGSTISFYKNLNEECALRTGMVGGNSFVVRAIPYISAGHVMHHFSILSERYL